MLTAPPRYALGEVVPASCSTPRRKLVSDSPALTASLAEQILGGAFEILELAKGGIMLVRLAPKGVILPINGRATIAAQGTILATDYVSGEVILLF